MSEISSVVKTYVSKNNVSIVRNSLVRELKYKDLDSLNTFISSLKYAEEKMPDLYEVDDGSIFSDDISEQNFEKLVNGLMDNFSEKKCKAVIEIGKSLFKESNNSIKNVEEQRGEKEDAPFSKNKQTKTIVVVVVSIIVLILLALKILK